MKIYHVETQENYDALMIEFEDKGYTWNSDAKPRNYNGFKRYGKDTYIYEEYGVISLSSGEYFKKYYSDETLVEDKAKGENMLNTECKQCNKKWHHTNAKYCAMCGKKLVAEPEFKVGDYVTDTSGDDPFICKIERIEGIDISGRWYCVSKNYFDRLIELPIPSSRLSTPEEKAEYKVALTFLKHDRKPFELKRGDVVYLKGYDKNIFLDSGNIYKKHNFIDGDVVLVKTAKEVNEWLGVSDE